MHDAFLVCRVERVRDLPRNGQRLGKTYRSAVKACRQRFARHEFEHEPADAVGLFESVDRADVGVIQGRQQTRFALEARQPLGIVRKRAR